MIYAFFMEIQMPLNKIQAELENQVEVLSEVDLATNYVGLFCSHSHSERPPKGLKAAVAYF